MASSRGDTAAPHPSTWRARAQAHALRCEAAGTPLCLTCAPICPGNKPAPYYPCVACGRPLWHLIRHAFAESVCSEACAEVSEARRELRRERKRARLAGIICASCGVSFKPGRRGDATTCSSACRQKLWRDRKREAHRISVTG
jgi:predicted nucleic acid-binding Zn ribbon protein